MENSFCARKMVFAIATLVMLGNKYVPGAVALAHSARIFSTATTVCMVTSDVTDREPLHAAFDEVVEVDKITVQAPRLAAGRATEIYGSWIADSPTKWRCLGLDKYEKVLFLDSDMVIVAPMDTLFSMPVPAGVFDHQMSSNYVTKADYTGNTPPGATGFVNRYIPPGKSNMSHGMKIDSGVVERLHTDGTQFAVHGGLVLVAPSKFAMNLLLKDIADIADSVPRQTISGIDELVITLFYHMNGYIWTHIDIRYNLAAYHMYKMFKDRRERGPVILHYITPYKPWTESRESVSKNFRMHIEVYDIWWKMYENKYLPSHQELKNTLQDIMSNTIGTKGKEVIERSWPTFQQVFVNKNINPVANYELMEAIGDKFLGGYYMWVLLQTPGIITPDQVTRISSYFQDAIRLSQILDYLKLTPYIQAEHVNTKVKSDIVEALIAAIGISYEKLYGRGDWAMHKFIASIYKMLPKIDAENYLTLYSNPAERMNTLVQELYLDRSKISESSPQVGGGKVVITVSYNGHLLGTGEASTRGVYTDTAIKQARSNAYLNALNTNALQNYVNRINTS